MGFIKNNCPGCTIHSSQSKNNMRDISFFGEKICNSFHCAANILLTNEYKNILINNIDDWLLYNIAIIDPESFIWISDNIHNNYTDNCNISLIKKLFEGALKKHFKYLSSLDIPIFYYSISEYNLNKSNFSLKCDNPNNRIERKKIIKELKEITSQYAKENS